MLMSAVRTFDILLQTITISNLPLATADSTDYQLHA